MIQNNVEFSYKNDTFHFNIIKLHLAYIGMCVLSVRQESIEISKIARVILYNYLLISWEICCDIDLKICY